MGTSHFLYFTRIPSPPSQRRGNLEPVARWSASEDMERKKSATGNLTPGSVHASYLMTGSCEPVVKGDAHLFRLSGFVPDFRLISRLREILRPQSTSTSVISGKNLHLHRKCSSKRESGQGRRIAGQASAIVPANPERSLKSAV